MIFNQLNLQLSKLECKFIATRTCVLVLGILISWNCLGSIEIGKAQILSETPVEAKPVEVKPTMEGSPTVSARKRRPLFAPDESEPQAKITPKTHSAVQLPLEGSSKRRALFEIEIASPVSIDQTKQLTQSNRIFQDAERLQEKSQFDAAIVLYQLIIEQNQRNSTAAEAMLRLAKLHIQLKHFAEAAEQLQRFQVAYPSHAKQDQAAYSLGLTRKYQGKSAEAAKEWQRVVEQFPDSNVWTSACIQLAKNHYNRQNYAQTEELLNRWLAKENQPRTSSTKSKQSNDYLPERSEILYLKAKCSIDLHDWEKVLPPLAMLLEETQENRYRLPAHFWIAESNAQLGKVATARSQLEQLAMLVVGNESWEPLVLLRLAQLRAESGEWASALRLATKLSKSKPTWQRKDEVDLLIGQCYASFGDMDLAREAYQRVLQATNIKEKRSNARARWFLGESYMQQKNYIAALPEFLRVAHAKGFSEWRVRGVLRAGRCYEAMDQWEQAAEQYRNANALFVKTSAGHELAKRLEIATRQINLRK